MLDVIIESEENVDQTAKVEKKIEMRKNEEETTSEPKKSVYITNKHLAYHHV